jgi:acyl carrier protein
MLDKLRAILAAHGKLSVDASTLQPQDDLFAAGLTSFATVQLMLAIEDAFDVEIPDTKLNRKTFSSLAELSTVIEELTGKAAA